MNIFQLCGEIVINGADAAVKAVKGVHESAEKLGSKLQSTGKAVGDFGKKFAAVSAGAAAVLGVSAKSAATFEDSMAKVSTIADTSQVSIGDLQNQIMDLSSKTGIAASDIAENVYNAISAGQQTGDAVNFVSNATALARAGFADTGSALDILTTVLNAYGLEAEEVTSVSDKLITTQNLGKTTVAELASSMGKVIPTAKATGVNIDQLCGAYAVMTSNGIATAETTTYLNSMLNELGKEGTTAAEAFRKGTEGIKEGGMSMAEAMESGMSLTDVLGVLAGEAEKSGTSINNLFGSAEAGKAANVLWDNVDKVDSAIAAMGNSTNATQTAYDKLNTTSFSVSKTLNQLKNVAIEFGTTLLEMAAPAIEKAASLVSKLSDWFNSLDDSQKKTIATVLALVAAFAPAAIMFKKVTSFASGLAEMFSFLCSPVGLVVVAIAALIAIGVALYQNWDTIKEKCSELAANISAKWNAMKDAVSEKAAAIKTAAVEKFEALKTGATEKIEALKSAATSKFDSIKSTISSKIEAARDAVKSAIEKIKSFFNFEWSLPKLKLPHFSVSGSFSLNPPSVPHFGIEWYKKAMDNPIMFTSPTIFGAGLGGLKGAGEAGDEVMIGKQTMLNMIREAVADESSVYLRQIIALLQMFCPEVLDAVKAPMKWDDAIIARKLAPAMDGELGVIAMKKGRGR